MPEPHRLEKEGNCVNKLHGSVALVTGGSSGFGMGTAKALKALGCTVVIAARKEAALKAAQQETGADDWLVLDVTKPADWDSAQAFINEKHGRLDFLINNAGGGVAIVPFEEQTQAQIDESIQLNLYGAMNGCRAFVPQMKARRSGLIINVLSVCATHAWPDFSVYSAAKAGLRMFSKCLYLELQPFGVRVTNFIPAAGNTNFGPNSNRPRSEVKLGGDDVGKAIASVCATDAHVFTEEITVWGIDQAVCPL